MVFLLSKMHLEGFATEGFFIEGYSLRELPLRHHPRTVLCNYRLLCFHLILYSAMAMDRVGLTGTLESYY